METDDQLFSAASEKSQGPAWGSTQVVSRPFTKLRVYMELLVAFEMKLGMAVLMLGVWKQVVQAIPDIRILVPVFSEFGHFLKVSEEYIFNNLDITRKCISSNKLPIL